MLRERFHFYINESDPIIQFLDNLIDHLYLHQNLYSEPNVVSNLKSVIEEFLGGTLNIKKHVKLLVDLKYNSHINKEHNFELFGCIYQSNCEIINNPELTLKTSKYKFQLNQIIITNYDYKSFFSLINSKYERNAMIKRNKNEKINDVSSQLFLPQITPDLCKKKIVVNEFETDIFLKISCKNKEFISNISLKILNQVLIKKNTICNSDSISFIFSCPNKFLTGSKTFESLASTDGFKILDDPIFDCFLTSHFNQVNFKLNTHDKGEFEIGFNRKQEVIENMDLDLLYLSAVFYANIFKNADSAKLRESSDQMVAILCAIDEIWNNDLDKTRNHIYNKKKEKQCYLKE